MSYVAILLLGLALGLMLTVRWTRPQPIVIERPVASSRQPPPMVPITLVNQFDKALETRMVDARTRKPEIVMDGQRYICAKATSNGYIYRRHV